MRILKENLFLQFSAISFVVMLTIAVILIIVLSTAMRSQAINALANEAKAEVSGRILRQITLADLKVPMTGERYYRFHNFVQESIVSQRTARVKLWAKDGTVIYSSDPESVGARFPDNESLLKALAGETPTAIKVPEAPENERERFLGTLIEVYTPIVFPGAGEAQGVLEIYQYYQPTAQMINEQRNRILTSLGLGFVILYGSLVGIVGRGWRTIIRQQEEQRQAEEKLDRLASFPELNPNPVIEIDLNGEVTYLNAAAKRGFPDFTTGGVDHPVLKALRSVSPVLSSTEKRSVTIETPLGDRIYEQHIYYHRGSQRLRSYIEDITERKAAEELKENIAKLKDALIQATMLLPGKLDLDSTLRETLSAAMRLSGARYGALFSIKENNIERVLYNGLTDEEANAIERCGMKRGLVEALITGKEVIRIPDIAADPRSVSFPKGHPLMKTFIGVPIKYGDGIVGALYLTDKETGAEFTQQDEDIIQQLAIYAGVAINNARLYEQLKLLSQDLEKKVEERTRELEVAAQVAEAASRAKSDFLASMSHELRTPLTTIIGFSEVLGEQYFGELNEKQLEYVKDVHDSAEHLLALINDILDLSKVEAGMVELQLSEFNVKDLLEGSLIMLKEKALRHGISLEVHLMPELDQLEITADQRRLKQVMFNLLSNAAKFTPDGGKITVEARQEGEELIVSVADTGIGIDPKDQKRIFEEFYQVQGGIRDKTSGTGLGLSLTKRFIEMHGGRVWLESEGKDKGSRFTFTLPIRHANRQGGL